MKMSFHAVTCRYCNRTFMALSDSAKFCSDACRSADYRLRKKHATNEPVPGLGGNAALMYVDIANMSPTAGRLIQALREKRGISAAKEAVYIAIAALFPGVDDPGLQMSEFFRDEMPQYMKDKLHASAN